MKQNKKILFCNCPCALNCTLLRNIMIFFLNFFKAIKFTLKGINMNRPAPNLQHGLGNEFDVGSCIEQHFLSSPGTNSAKKSNKSFKYSFVAMLCFDFFAIKTIKTINSSTSFVIFRSHAPTVSWALVCLYRSL